MSEVDEQEINKVIAEFMGWSEDATTAVPTNEGSETIIIGKNEIPTKYTRSLDSLVPVWEKICMDFNENAYYEFHAGHRKHFRIGNMPREFATSLPLAAALSTYKAIKVLEGRG